jgi:hypothetical protein
MKKLSVMILFFALSARLFSLNLWRHGEAADKNTIFLDAAFAALSYESGFSAFPPEFRACWMFPFFLPVSIEAFFRTPDPNLKSFGLRAGYHIDTGSPKLDLYFLYVFDFGFLRNDLLEEYGDEKQEIHYWDFRAGLRYLTGSRFAIFLETGFKLREINLGVSLKIF